MLFNAADSVNKWQLRQNNVRLNDFVSTEWQNNTDNTSRDNESFSVITAFMHLRKPNDQATEIKNELCIALVSSQTRCQTVAHNRTLKA